MSGETLAYTILGRDLQGEAGERHLVRFKVRNGRDVDGLIYMNFTQ